MTSSLPVETVYLPGGGGSVAGIVTTDRGGLRGKVALITGGASGIGRALGVELARRGAEVLLADRQGELAGEAAAAIRAEGGAAAGVELDVRSRADFRKVADDLKARAGRIDYLFNNAGIGVGAEIERCTPEDWDDVVDVNLRGVIHGVEAVYPTMVAQGSGHVVNTASMAGLVPAAGEAGYTATKHAVVGLTKALRVEGRRHGVRASALCPGAIRTPILTGGRYGRIRLDGVSAERVMAVWERMRPMAPEAFAAQAVDAVLADVPFIVIPSWWKPIWYLDRLSPSLSVRLWELIFRRTLASLRG